MNKPESVISVQNVPSEKVLSEEEPSFAPEDFHKVDSWGQPYLLFDSTGFNTAHAYVNPAYNQDPSRPRDPGWFGSLFQQAGYNYLGPGTDLEYNERHGVKPVNDLDAAAQVHDQEYRTIGSLWERGRLTESEMKREIALADLRLWQRMGKSWDPMSNLAQHGMTMKMIWDYLTDSASFSGLSAENKGDLADEDEGPVVDYPELRYDATINPYEQFGDPGEGLIWVYGSYGWETSSSRHPGEYAPPRPAVSVSRIQVSEDRDNNGIPDVMQKRRRRRHRFHPIA